MFFPGVAMLAAGVRAQASPAHFADVNGNAAASAPLGFPVTGRTLQIHGDVSGSTRPIRAIAFRRQSQAGGTFSPVAMTLTLAMSTGATSPTTPSSTFEANHGSDRRVVFARRQVSFGATQAGTAMPPPFDYVIPLDAGFPYTGTGPLVWDLTAEAPSAAATRPTFDAADLAANAANPPLSVREFGTGCLATGQVVPMRVAMGSVVTWATGDLSVDVGGTGGPRLGAGLAVLGFDNLDLGGVALPIEVPGSRGAPSRTCAVFTDVVFTLPLGLDAAGARTVALPLRVDPTMHGATLFHQLWAVDPPANPLGVVTSSAGARQLIAPFAAIPCARVQAVGSTGPTGGVAVNFATVTRFVR